MRLAGFCGRVKVHKKIYISCRKCGGKVAIYDIDTVMDIPRVNSAKHIGVFFQDHAECIEGNPHPISNFAMTSVDADDDPDAAVSGEDKTANQ